MGWIVRQRGGRRERTTFSRGVSIKCVGIIVGRIKIGSYISIRIIYRASQLLTAFSKPPKNYATVYMGK